MSSDINAAYLLAQLENAEKINTSRLSAWDLYNQGLSELAAHHFIELPYVPDQCIHNAHMYYIKVKDNKQRGALISHLKSRGIAAVFHYIPLHSSVAGKNYGEFRGKDLYTTSESERLLRLPMFYGISADDVSAVISGIHEFFYA